MTTMTAAAILTMVAMPTLSWAQTPPRAAQTEKPLFVEHVTASENVPELTVETGYTQGLGMLHSRRALPDVASGGIGFGAGVGYRFDPRWGLSLSGQYQELSPVHAAGVRGLTGTIAVQYHVRPDKRIDPWLELGFGYRALWETFPGSQPNAMTHGFQIARLRIGAELRADENIALGPFLGADASMFLGREESSISDPRLSTFIQLGIQGRFDISRAPTMPRSSASAGR